jgi:hypothetical protein
MLSRYPKRCAARRQHRHSRAGIEQLYQLGRYFPDLLQVVERQEDLGGAELRAQMLGDGRGIVVTQTDRVGNGWEDEGRVAELCQRDEIRTIRKLVRQVSSQHSGETRFPNASRAGEREQTNVWLLERRSDPGAFTLAANQGPS